MASRLDKIEAIAKDNWAKDKNHYVYGRSTVPIRTKHNEIRGSYGRMQIKPAPIKIRNGILMKDLNNHPLKR